MNKKPTEEEYEIAIGNGVSRSSVQKRIRLGWSVERAISTPTMSRQQIAQKTAFNKIPVKI